METRKSIEEDLNAKKAALRKQAYDALIPRADSETTAYTADYYAILDLPKDASQQDIDNAFLRRYQDVGEVFDNVPENVRIAYGNLGNPQQREYYKEHHISSYLEVAKEWQADFFNTHYHHPIFLKFSAPFKSWKDFGYAVLIHPIPLPAGLIIITVLGCALLDMIFMLNSIFYLLKGIVTLDKNHLAVGMNALKMVVLSVLIASLLLVVAVIYALAAATALVARSAMTVYDVIMPSEQQVSVQLHSEKNSFSSRLFQQGGNLVSQITSSLKRCGFFPSTEGQDADKELVEPNKKDVEMTL